MDILFRPVIWDAPVQRNAVTELSIIAIFLVLPLGITTVLSQSGSSSPLTKASRSLHQPHGLRQTCQENDTSAKTITQMYTAVGAGRHAQSKERQVSREAMPRGSWLAFYGSVRRPVYGSSETQRGSSIGHHYTVCQWQNCKTPTWTWTSQGWAEQSRSWYKGQLTEREFTVHSSKSQREYQVWNCLWEIYWQRDYGFDYPRLLGIFTLWGWQNKPWIVISWCIILWCHQIKSKNNILKGRW